MARLGGSTNPKQTENGKGYFGDKDVEFLKKQSRQAVEEIHNAPILFLELDWENCHRNFYGEMTVKKFKHPQGIQVRGSYKIRQGELTHQNGIPYKSMNLTVSLFVEQMKELGIDPQRGEYFYIGKRYYQIWDKSIIDAGVGNVLMTREKMQQDFHAFEVDDETIQNQVKDPNPGPEYNISNQSGEIID